MSSQIAADDVEAVTIIGGPRDRFSTTERWLDRLFATTPGAGDRHRVIFVAGGAPDHLRRRWQERFGDRVEFVFHDEFLNQPQVRNIGLRMATTELAVLADNDCYPRSGWLEAMVRCQHDTDAVMVTPLILERPTTIHCAGTDLYKNIRDGVEYGHKYLRFLKRPYVDGCNLERSTVDYGELHLELVKAEPTLELGAFDERIIEVGEVDSGLTWAEAGYSMWFEPAAVVHFERGGPITVDDVAFFSWRWDFDRVAEGYRVFADKWGFDISEEGIFGGFVVDYNATVGWLARRYPSSATLKLGLAAKRLGNKFVGAPSRARATFRRAVQGTRNRKLGPVEVAGRSAPHR